jgi:hypothetical protein
MYYVAVQTVFRPCLHGVYMYVLYKLQKKLDFVKTVLSFIWDVKFGVIDIAQWLCGV